MQGSWSYQNGRRYIVPQYIGWQIYSTDIHKNSRPNPEKTMKTDW